MAAAGSGTHLNRQGRRKSFRYPHSGIPGYHSAVRTQARPALSRATNPHPMTARTMEKRSMHHRHHEDPTHHERHESPTSLTAPASWRSGHSPAGGAPEPGPAPGVAGPVMRRGAPDGEAATEGGSQLGKAVGKRRTKTKGKARPRAKKQRPAQSVRLSDQEHAIIQAGADAVGMSLAGFLAHSALAAARDQARTAATIATERDVLTELFALRRQFGWAGSNLNQLTKALNSGGDVTYVKEVLADVQRVANAAQQAVDRVANLQGGGAA